MTTSSDGRKMIAGFEQNADTLHPTGWGLGAYDAQGVLVGIYPHYVFKEDGNGGYISDGGITFGYGHWISQAKYNANPDSKLLIDTYCPGASFLPTTIPSDGVSYVVRNSSYISLQKADDLLSEDLKSAEDAVNDFLDNNNVKLNQHQFDALVSFTHQYGENWWTKTPEKVLPKFIRQGNGNYAEADARNTFALHDDPKRRAVEAEVFINGY
ncbi:lysozyme [Lacrimispora sp.]|uniref:lysozyme n=1 Tax=Lacrimispora sp. TaxID=2719234 RepID=UPI0028A14BD0|nr:glycoside hydrolase family protein [Lacrimispora sp.]